MRVWSFGVLAVLVACTGSGPGTGTQPRPDPEICDDGVDNNDNGLVDCDDEDACGGLACAGSDTTPIDTAPEELPVEVLYNPADCCNFNFTFTEDCPEGVTIGTITFANRTEDRGEIDLSCDLVGGESLIQWQLPQLPQPVEFVVNADIEAGEEVVATGTFVCIPGANQTFTTECFAKIQTGEYIIDDVTFSLTGTAL